MAGSNSTPAYGWLIFGIFMIVLAVNGTCTGEAWASFGRVVDRAKEPRQFWWLVAMEYLVGVFFIGAAYGLFQ
jgi:hypothetical protein